MLRAKAFDMTNVFLLLEKHVDILCPSSYSVSSGRNFNMLQRWFSDFAKTLNVTFGAETERVKASPPTSKEIGAGFVNAGLCLLKVRAKLSPGVGVC